MINSRKVTDLHPVLQTLAKRLILNSKKHGVDIIITSTLRDDAYQRTLYAQGRTRPGNIVTNCEVTGAHGLGLAFDVVPVVGGKAVYDSNKKWQVVIAEGHKLGLTCGGDWKSFPDKPHFEFCEGLTFRQLRAGKRPSFFKIIKKVGAKK